MDITLDTTPKHRHLLSPRTRSSTFRPPGAPVLPDSLSCSLAERHTTAGVAVSLVVGVASSAAAPHLRQLLPAPPTPRASTARPGSPRARAAASCLVATPPREVGPALPGRRVAPASEIRGLSIVLGSPSPSSCSSLSSGRRGPSCRKSRWSSRRRDGSTPGGLARPDSTCRGRVSPTLTSSDS